MPIDPSQVSWDAPAASPARIDPSAVQWDPPAPPAAAPAVGAAEGLGMGLLRGGKDIIDTGAHWLASGFDKFAGTHEGARVGAMNDVGKSDYEKAYGDSTAASIGRVGGQIAATLPVGGLLGAGVRAAGAAVGAGAAVAPLAQAVATGGFRAGGAGPLTRALGGAINGGATAGLVNPDDAGAGAAIGAALPPALQGAGKVAGIAAQGVRSVFQPADVKAAGSILQAAGARTPDEINAIRGALQQQGPNIVGEAPTVPQILQNPGVSQLARTLRNSGDTSLLAREQAQDASRLATLDRVSPVTGTVQQSADNFGNALAPRVRAADEAARARTHTAFEGVDPDDMSALHLPIEGMQRAESTFLGPGTFGTGQRASQAIDTARQIGETELPAVGAATGGMQRQQTLMQAVRAAGGINRLAGSSKAYSGELRDLSQSGGKAAMSGMRGTSIDAMANRMHRAGFIDDADPVTLMNALRDSANGESVLSRGADQTGAFQRAFEGAQGEAPGASTIANAVPFRQVQNLRSSISEAAESAASKGANREAAALRQMVGEIDASVERAADGFGNVGEHFPEAMVARWQAARRLKADQMERFRTGPQQAIFQRGGDGEALAQGGELAPKFFSPRGSQSADVAAFRRVADNETTPLLKNYAITDLANQTDRFGRLTNSKVSNWVDRRSGALGGLLDDGERAQVTGVARDLDRADRAASLGMATGSNTAQNVDSAMSLGLLDNPAARAIANRVPLAGQAFNALREGAKKAKVKRLGELLADPEVLAEALAQHAANQRPGLAAQRLARATSAAAPGLFRAAPLLGSGP